ncbi:MAG: SpoIIIAH-like family protein [Eubacteriales bacterium]|nr:SpoIIIAH-like family protein [Eubacteriales bacterium]
MTEEKKMAFDEECARDEVMKKPARKRKQKEKPVLDEAQIRAKRARNNKFTVAVFVLLLGVGVMGNWYYENTDLSSNIKPIINNTKTLGQAELVDATTTQQVKEPSEYFSSARVDRQTARDEALEKLQAVVDSTDKSKDAKRVASEEISRISSNISIENKIETLVTAKGVDNCLAVVNNDGSRVDIIVDAEKLTDELIMQIKDIAMQQLGCSFENISIIQSK